MSQYVSNLKKNEKATICNCENDCLLSELGFCDGTEIEMILPGDISIVRIFGCKMALGKKHCESIKIENIE